jgi:hypothetical protein
MKSTNSSVRLAGKVVGFGILSFAIAVGAGVIWSALLIINLRTNPAIPWSIPMMGLVLWAAWQS